MNVILLLILVLRAVLMLIICVVGVISIYFLLNSGFMRRSPPVPSSGQVKKALIEDVAKVLSKRRRQVVMDLGSGWGTLLLPLARRFPHHQFIGIEYGCIPYWISRLRARQMPNLTFLRRDFFKTDISDADVILTFLLTSEMARLTQKCQTEAKKGALVYANRFRMKKVPFQRKVSFGSDFNTYYVYKM